MYPDKDSLEKVRDMQAKGLKNTIKKDDDGYYVTWTRKTQIDGKAGIIPLTPPAIFQRDENGEVVPFNGENVGNGSDVTTKLQFRTFKSKAGGTMSAARWESSLIEHLVPFEGAVDFTEQEAKAFKGLDSLPAPAGW
jgi:hypothetical protein